MVIAIAKSHKHPSGVAHEAHLVVEDVNQVFELKLVPEKDITNLSDSSIFGIEPRPDSKIALQLVAPYLGEYRKSSHWIRFFSASSLAPSIPRTLLASGVSECSLPSLFEGFCEYASLEFAWFLLCPKMSTNVR